MKADLKSGIVRILTPSGDTVGTGFVVTPDGLIATCAHVIRYTGAEPGSTVNLSFYATKQTRVARVEPDCYRIPEAEDIAILRLDGQLPEKATPLPLGRSFNTQGQTFLSFGFPEAKSKDGLFGECKVIGIVSEKVIDTDSEEEISLLQLSSKEIAHGFSGGPVWDAAHNAVIGMVTSIIGPTKIRMVSNKTIQFPDLRPMEIAFATPAEIIQIVGHIQISEECPYQGLDAFTEDHAKFFFGRKSVVDTMVNRLKKEARFLAVLGASGSGKSSIVRAGLVPLLRGGAVGDSDHWGIIVIRPADDPFKQLFDRGLLIESQDLVTNVRAWTAQYPSYTRFVLVIDQFEELLTTCSEVLRKTFVKQLTQLLAAPLPITVILVIRSDFFGQFAQQENLTEWIALSQVIVPSELKLADLTAIVQKPAEVARLRFEEGLVELIVNDAMDMILSSQEDEKTARSTILPLLEFALKQLWERRDKDGLLTWAAYNAIDGVKGGLTKWADRAFYNLRSEEERNKARHIFTKLVHIGNEDQKIPDSRRQMPLIKLCREEYEFEEIHQIVLQFTNSRLLVTTYDMQSEQKMADIIHDALLWEWRKLQK